MRLLAAQSFPPPIKEISTGDRFGVRRAVAERAGFCPHQGPTNKHGRIRLLSRVDGPHTTTNSESNYELFNSNSISIRY